MTRAICSLSLLLSILPTIADAQPKRVVMETPPDPGLTKLSTETVVIPIDIQTMRPTVELLVDGQGPYKFVVDTGAGLSVIDAAIAETLGLETVGEQILRSPGAKEGVKGEQVRAQSLAVGGLRIDRPVLVTMDLVGFSGGVIEGVLGRPHFQNLLLTLDYPGSQLRLTRGALDPASAAVLPYDKTSGAVRFAVDVGGVQVPMVVDSGSPGGFSLPKAMESQFTFSAPPQKGPTIHLVGATHETWVAPLAGTIRMAGLEYPEPEVKLTTIGDEFGNIGFGVLRELAITLDQANGLVRLERQAASVERVVRVGGPTAVRSPSGPARIGVAFEQTQSGFVRRDGGLVVRYVEPGGSGEQAGLEAGDIVTAMGNVSLETVRGISDLAKLVRGPRPMPVEVLRAGKTLHLTIE